MEDAVANGGGIVVTAMEKKGGIRVASSRGEESFSAAPPLNSACSCLLPKGTFSHSGRDFFTSGHDQRTHWPRLGNAPAVQSIGVELAFRPQ